jgi:DNA-binding MarR family transcriptional regulator
VSGALKERYALDDQAGYLLRLATQRHTAIFHDHMPDGLTAPQFATLVRLHANGPCSQNALGRLVAIDIATIKGIVDRLKQKGLVETQPSAEDKRRHIVSLTPKAHHRMSALLDAGSAITAETLAPLSASEQTKLLKLLRKLT